MTKTDAREMVSKNLSLLSGQHIRPLLLLILVMTSHGKKKNGRACYFFLFFSCAEETYGLRLPASASNDQGQEAMSHPLQSFKLGVLTSEILGRIER